MTGLERTLNTLSGRKTDRVPVALHNYIMAGRMMNLSFDTYPKSGELLAKAQIHAWELLGHDVLMIENGVAAMAEAVGCEVAYSPNQPPRVKKCVLENLDEVQKLKIPVPDATFPLNELIKAVKIIKNYVGDKAFVMGRSDQGPMALAYAIYGTEKLIMDIALGNNPEKVHALIDFCTNCAMRFASSLHRAGSHGTCIGGCGLSTINPKIFREFELPYQKKFVEHCHKESFYTGIHICGNEDAILDDMVSSGADWLELDPLTSPEKAANTTKGRCAVLGMIDPVKTLLNETPRKITEECRRRIKQMSRTSFILGPGCALPADCPVENIKALVNAAKNRQLKNRRVSLYE